MSIGSTSISTSAGTAMRTVVVLGAAYGGAHAAQMLGASLPANYRVLVVDRNSHMNHVYVFPRFITVPRLAPKGFIPYYNMFAYPPLDFSKPKEEVDKEIAERAKAAKSLPTPPATRDGSPEPDTRHEFIQANVVSLSKNSLTILKPDAEGSYDGVKDDGSDAPSDRLCTIDFDYCIYALGAGLPAPCDVWGEYGRTQLPGRGTKAGGLNWMNTRGELLAKAERIVLVGAGALGIQFATDLKDLYPSKEVTLLHSRTRVLPRYPQEMHDEVIKGLERAGVQVVLGERVTEWPENPDVLGEPKVVRTDKGSEFTADLVLACTGQKPHVDLVRGLGDVIADTGRIRVKPTTQIQVGPISEEPKSDSISAAVEKLSLEPSETLDHIFAVGDCADTTAIQAGHTAYWQGEVAVRNLLRLVKAREGEDLEELETYAPGAPAIKVTLGLKHYVIANADGVKPGDDGVEDLQARLMWPTFNAGEFDDDA